MIKIGVLGAGHLGKIHIQQIKEIDAFELVGFYDNDAEQRKLASEKFGVNAYDDPMELINSVDAIDIVTPTLSHYEYAEKALTKFKHAFIEKPIANHVTESARMIELAREAGVKVQIGHVERFNPAFIAARPYFKTPMFIEAHRLAQFNPRGTDVSVVLDLMIHDIDIVLKVVPSKVKKITTSGVAVVSDTPDIANARIEFDNGCVANLTASRMSLKNMRKTRFFQKDAYISVDFLEKKSEVVRLKNLEGEPGPLDVSIDLGAKGKKLIYFDHPRVEESNAIREELKSFAEAIVNNTETAVTIEDGHNALHVAHQIVEKLKTSPAMVS
ncbi:MAG: Gfo/Idh/MocA family oxidoreductase [Bacteroidia bacterium]|nr:Gfo/Idh/MocA family oxidoreductase [Bacteroidia bacterium]NNM16530.1 Gfo/Idh/MocA family oxidoreductase [Bacteroidia bacterium]